MTPDQINNYREATNKRKNPGNMAGRKFCSCCGVSKLRSDGVFTMGTSIWNPSRFVCNDCTKGDTLD